MSLFRKIKRAVAKGSKYLPALALAVPGSKALANAATTLQTVSGVLQGGGIVPTSIPGIGGPISTTGVMPMSIAASRLPAFPALPGGGGIVKTGLPLLAAGTALARTAAPALISGGRALLARVSPKVARALGWVTIGGLVYDAAGNLQGATKRRQMNPLNARAARRAVRRIKSVRKLCQRIESTLPRQKKRC
ncbi:MAG: hypothetical protein ACREXV_19970 [Polaromonas sp.]